jgi:hypothetical protein
MSESTPQQPPSLLHRTAATLQAGMSGALLVGLWQVFRGWLLGEPALLYFNVSAGFSYGARAWRGDYGFHTLTGIGWHFLCFALPAIVLGLVLPAPARRLTSHLWGFVLGAFWVVFCWDALSRRYNPVFAHSSISQTLYPVALLYGACLGLYWNFARQPERTEAESSVTASALELKETTGS